MKFCSNCGGPVVSRIPDADDRERFVCDRCQTVHYRNPKMVVGTVPQCEGKILLCRRAIAPQRGLWTLPAGYLEMGETVSEGARRETLEEAEADIRGLIPFGLYNLSFVGQVYFMLIGDLAGPKFSAGSESLEVDLFTEADIPWDELAFRVIAQTLRDYFSDRQAGLFGFHMGDILPERP
jgi:ADP-ribose pyrophosphatase YjhB (NUDIX family)